MASKRKNHRRDNGHRSQHAYEQTPAPVGAPVYEEPAPTPQMHESDRIGDILRRVREHRGEDLEFISDYLRIRPDYLFALENSRYDQLPADAYVIGFLRTYAAYLGLDGRGAIDQYRREMAGRRRKPQLTMPQPMPEGRAPTLILLIAAAVAGIIVYGIWYGLSTPDEEVAKQTLPISEVVEPTVQDSSSILLPATPAPEPVTLNNEAPAAETPKVEEKKPEEPKAEAPKVEAPKAEPPKVEPPKAEPPKPEPPKTEPPKVEPPKTDKPQAEAPAPVETPAAEAAEAAKPQSYGEKGKSRVTVRADKDSWVLITDKSGITLFERTLKAGETYNVPDGKNLNLTTGNVAGVSLLIDGAEMPRLPATGKVARGVPLDPDKLRSRLTAPLPAKQPGETPSKAEETDSASASD